MTMVVETGSASGAPPLVKTPISGAPFPVAVADTFFVATLPGVTLVVTRSDASGAGRRTCAAAGKMKATCWSTMKAAVRTASRGRRAEATRLPLGNEVGTEFLFLSWLECFAGWRLSRYRTRRRDARGRIAALGFYRIDGAASSAW